MKTEATKRVRMKVSLAGLGDPDIEALDRKYAEESGRWAKMGMSQKSIEKMIDDKKERDGYHRTPIGMSADFSYKIDDIAVVPVTLADKWIKSGLAAAIEPLNKTA